MGDRARGLQRRRLGLGFLPARPRALTSVPVGRGRPARHLRPARLCVLRARALEWEGPVPQRAALRPLGPAGQPRRGRQGAVLLPRLDPDALLHEGSLQVSATRVPLPPARRGKRPPQPAGPGARADRHGHLRRRPLLRRVRRVRQGESRRRAHPDRGCQPRPRSRAPASSAHTLVSQRVVVGPGQPPAAPAGGRGRRLRLDRGRARLLRHPAPGVRGVFAAALHGERDKRPRPLGGRERVALGQGRLSRVCGLGKARRRQSGEGRLKGGSAVRARRPRRRFTRSSPAAVNWQGAGQSFRPSVHGGVRRAHERGQRVLRAALQRDALQ